MQHLTKYIQTSSFGNYFCPADVGTAKAMADLGAAGTRLPEWLVTQATMQACSNPPAEKGKLWPDCLIVEIPKSEVPLAPGKHKRNVGPHEQTASTQTGGRPWNVWILELRYCTDTRYVEKVQLKTEQHEKLCELLTAEAMMLSSSP